MVAHTESHFGIVANQRGCRIQAVSCTIPLLLASYLFLWNTAFSQHPLNFDRITQREGLSDASVLAICQDACGTMWFGTDQGLERYDGYGFRTFKIGKVRDLCADDRGYVWIVSWEVGLYCYDIANDTLISYAPAPDDQDRQNRRWLSSLFLDREGILWLGTMAGEGVIRFDTERRQYLGPLETPLTEDGPTAIQSDDAGNLWFAMQSGVLKYDKTSGHAMFYGHSMNTVTVNIHVAFGRDGRIWVNGGQREGLLWLDTARNEWHKILLRGKAVSATNVLLDDAGRLWVTTGTDGLKVYDPASATWEEYHHRSSDPRSLTSDRINTIYRDKAGNLWFGTLNGVSKIARWRKQFWPIPHNTDDANSPPKGPIRSICEDRDGNLWIASYGDGVKMWNRRTGIFKSISGISSFVHVVHSDSSGWIWIACDNPYSLVAIIPETGRRRIFKYDATDTLSIPAGPILSLSDDVDGSLCVGTGNGEIGYLDPRSGKCTRLTRPTPPMQGWVARSLYLDRAGKRWSSFGGILLVVSGKPRHASLFKPQVPLKDWEWVISAMYEDGMGRFWVGTIAGFGLLDRTNGRLTYWRRDDQAYQSSATYGILNDDQENLWLMTTNGVTRFRPETKEFTDFGIADGYPPTNISTNAFHGTSSFCRTKDGFLVFGTGEGIVLFHPDSLHDNPNPPTVILTDLKVAGATTRLRMNTLSGRRMVEYRPLDIPYNQNSVEFTFSALDYTAPLQNTYVRKLEGLEESWSPASNDRSAEYANLSPGNYVFRVKAANNDGVWNEEGAFIRITVLPPWWMTWWFRTSIALSAICVIVLIILLVVRRAVSEERLRTDIARNLHDDLSGTLSSITFYSEAITRSGGEQMQHYIGRISESAREAKEKTSDIIWSVDPHYDDADDFLARCERYASDMLDSKGILHEMKIDKSLSSPLAHDLRQNLWLIFKEIIVNLVQHSGCSRATISITRMKNNLVLNISDNGKGFDAAASYRGKGLRNIRNRAAGIGATVVLDTAPEGGTQWKIEVRM